ncbi:hypothetical protein JTB14_003454 [Gonioctena quinquepunctata]|nr:hypothetical protein JTB14_003454 [Gonioctena quinquepunctata]
MEFLKQPEEMSLDGDLALNWKKFKAAYKLYIVASGCSAKEDKVKAAILLHIIGNGAREILETLSLTEDEKQDEDKILQEFEKYFVPKTNVSIERHKFNTRCQLEGEYFDSFLKDLRTIAASCNFGQLQSSLIKDRIVCGISDKRIKDRLLREQNLELNKAIEICKAAEESDKHIKKLYNGNEYDKEMCEIQKSEDSRYMEKVQRHQRNTNFQNRRCGWNKSQPSTSGASPCGWNKSQPSTSGAYPSIMQRHTPSRIVTSCPKCGYSPSHKRCPAEGRRCNRCNRFGHFGKVCRYETKHEICHLVDTRSEQSGEDIDEHDEYLLGSVDDCFNEYEWCVRLRILNGNKNIVFKVDTGAQVNAIPLYVFQELRISQNLRPCKSKITNYSESSLEERVSLENKEVSEENECNERTENEVVGEFVKKKNELLSQRGLCDDSKIQEDYSLQRTDDNYCPRTKFGRPIVKPAYLNDFV